MAVVKEEPPPPRSSTSAARREPLTLNQRIELDREIAALDDFRNEEGARMKELHADDSRTAEKAAEQELQNSSRGATPDAAQSPAQHAHFIHLTAAAGSTHYARCGRLSRRPERGAGTWDGMGGGRGRAGGTPVCGRPQASVSRGPAHAPRAHAAFSAPASPRRPPPREQAKPSAVPLHMSVDIRALSPRPEPSKIPQRRTAAARWRGRRRPRQAEADAVAEAEARPGRRRACRRGRAATARPLRRRCRPVEATRGRRPPTPSARPRTHRRRRGGARRTCRRTRRGRDATGDYGPPADPPPTAWAADAARSLDACLRPA